MNDTRILILRLRHDSPTRDTALEAADMIEKLSAPQRSLPHSQTARLGYDGDDFPEPGIALPPFDGVEAAQMACRPIATPAVERVLSRATPTERASIRMCSCVDGVCQNPTDFRPHGMHCRANLIGG